MLGKVYPSEKLAFRDPETGAEITQYTQVGATNRTLYFTNRPYVEAGERMVFLSDRTGRNQMFVLHFKTGQIVQVTDADITANVSSCVHPSRPELYFCTTQGISRVNLETLQTEELLRAPAGYGIGILNLNSPPWLAFEMSEKLVGLARIKDGQAVPAGNHFERHYQRPRSLIYRFHVDDGRLECLWGEFALLTHVQVSPTNPVLLIYSDWCGYDRERVYYLNLQKRLKSPPRPLLGETASSRGSHECFTRRGNLALQWMEGDLQEGGEHQLMHAFKLLAGRSIAEVESAPFQRFAMPEKNGSLLHHFTMCYDETWGVHDRWPTAPTFEQNMAWLSVFQHQAAEPPTKLLKLCFHNGAKGDRLGLGAELTLDDCDEFATYTSFLTGAANICQVRVAPFVERLRKL